MIEFKEVIAGYGREHVLKGISCSFRGKSLVLGPNGSGKTTILKTIVGLVKIISGTVRINEKSVEEIMSTSGLVATNLEDVYKLLSLDSFSLVKLYADLMDFDPEDAFNITEGLGVTREYLKKRKLHELSAGQRKIVCNAMAIASKSEHVLLDEPFEQLDPARKTKLLSIINDINANIVLNTHETWIINGLENWNVYFMFEGRIYGPMTSEDLKNASIAVGKHEGAILTIETSRGPISLIKEGEGRSLTDLISLDKVYELLLR